MRKSVKRPARTITARMRFDRKWALRISFMHARNSPFSRPLLETESNGSVASTVGFVAVVLVLIVGRSDVLVCQIVQLMKDLKLNLN
jgi:hypothetical protein